MKRILSWILAIVLTVGCVPVNALEVEAAAQTYTIQTATAAEQEGMDAEELLDGYAYQLFYGGVETYGRKAGDRLSGDEKLIYDALVPIIKQIAAGERTSTVIGLGQEVVFNDEVYAVDVPVAFTTEVLNNEMLTRIIAALLTDMPYEMFWYDKVNGTASYALVGGDCVVVYLRLSFQVADNYQGAGPYTVDCAEARTAATAAKNSAAIINKYAGNTDYEKLVAYKNEICNLVSYDYNAAYTGSFSLDNDPWQLIYVFDGDETTNVVCEGYSKAFAYLCEQTAFDGDIYCITVSGQMGGPHMWNIVSIEGKSYLVDVTNSDASTVGADGSLFLAGGTGDIINGYTVSGYSYNYFDIPNAEMDEDLLLWGGGADCILKLSPVAYEEAPEGQVASGVCGENLVWRLDDTGTLKILGAGQMHNYSEETTPWYAYKDSILNVVLAENVQTIGSYAFYKCSGMTRITIPGTLQQIGSYAFFGCASLETAAIPDSVTYIGWYAFCMCSSLKDLSLGSGIKKIESGTFNQCTSLEEVVLPEGLVTLGQAFSQCSALKSVTFPATLQKITGDAFWYCEALTDVYIRDADAWCKVDFENDYANPNLYAKQLHLLDENGQEVTGITLGNTVTSIPNFAFKNMTALTSVSIPATVDSIGEYAFGNCVNLMEASVPETLTIIPEGLFQGCGKLTSFKIPGAVTKIDQYAFDGCSSLSDFDLFYGITEIGENAFRDCIGASSVFVPSSITTIGSGAFYGCTGLTAVYISDLDAWCRIDFGNSGANPLAYAGDLYVYGAPVTELDFPTGIGKVNDYAFFNCTSLTSVTIPNDVEQVGIYAFANCSNLTDVVLKIGVKQIGDGVFQRCSALTYVSIPVTVRTIGGWAFCECTGLTEIAIPDSVTDIGSFAFSDCKNLDSVTITDVDAWCQIQFADWWSNPLYNGATLYLSGERIKDMVISEAVQEIGKYAFIGQTDLVSVTLPAGLTAVGERAFEKCSSLTDVYFLGTEYQWQQVNIGIYNEWLEQATLHFTDGHVHSLVYYEGKDPTCSQVGWNAYKSCSTCQYTTYEEIPTIEHSYTSEEVSTTCTTDGYIIVTCEDCGYTYTYVYQQAWGHSWDDGVVTVAPTEESTGIKTYTCRNCPETKTEVLPTVVHTHSYNAVTTPATCEESGYTTHTCACGDSYVDTPVAAMGHNMGKWSVTVPAECNTAGTQIRTCTRCDYEESEQISPTGKHNYVPTVTPPTCTQQGYTTYTCACGDRYVGDYTPVSDHSYNPIVYKPTCTEQGFTIYICSCGEKYIGDYVEPAGHAYGDWVDVKAPTCLLPGTQNRTCSLCFTVQAQTVPATGHKYNPTEVVAPTYSAGGYTVYTCVCGDSYTDDAVKPLTLPKLTIQVAGGMLQWEYEPSVDQFEIYRATSKSGKYTKIGTAIDHDYQDTSASVGKTYYYKVRAIIGYDAKYNSGYSNVVSIAYKCAEPELVLTTNTSGKPVLTWNKVSGAKKYEVYRATSETGKYTKVTTVTKATYTDSKASTGTRYFYKVRAVASSSTYNSGYSNITSCWIICATPAVTTKIDTSTGRPGFTWSAVSGAVGYRIYRRLPGVTGFEEIAQVTGKSFTDTTAAIDTQYEYRVQAVGKSPELDSAKTYSMFVTSGLAQPKVTGTVNDQGKPVISWPAVDGAVKYTIYRSTSSSKNFKAVETVADLSYTDTSVAAGKTYYYKVSATGQNSVSSSSAALKLTGKCAIPELTVKAGSTGKPVLTWNKISGAKKYEIWRSVDGGKFKKLTTVTKTTYTDSKATAGAECTYKVKALGSKSSYNGNFSEVKSCYVTCAAPSLTIKVDTATGRPGLSWKKVTGAVAYAIYRDGELLATVTGTSYKDEAVTPGVKYSYTLVSLGKMEVFNSVESAAKTATATCAQPKLTGSLDPATGKPVLTWGAVEGAEGYAIYRSTKKSSGYKKIGTAEENTYLDTAATAKKTYYYKVEALAGSTKSSQSSYVKLKCGSGPIPVKVTAVEISGPSQVMVGNKITLTAAVTPENAANKAVTWSISSGSSYASISSDGVLTAKKIGTVKVKATAKDGSGKSDTYTVAVVKKTLWEGSGTKSNPYLLRTVDDLLKLSEVLGQSGLYFKQVADIDCASVANWIAIGTEDKPFRHNIDGGGYTISNICLDGEAGALIAYATDAAFTNMKIANAYTTENGVTNRYSTNTAALVGYGVGCSFENCSAAVDFKQSAVVTGGLAGYIVLKRGQKDLMTNCAVTGRISGGGYVGGLVGQIGRSFYGEDYADNQSTGIRIVDSRADVQIQSDGVGNSRPAVGGLAGEANLINIESSYTTGAIVAISGDVGGLVGYTLYATEIIRCYSEMEITCTTNSEYGGVSAGGLIGQMVAYAVVHDCYATGNVNLPNGGWSPCQDSTSVNGGPWLGYYNPCGSLIGSIKTMSIYDSKYYQIELYNCYATGTVNAPKICEDERVYCHGALVGLVLDNHTRRHITDTTKADQSDWAGFSKTAIYRFESNYNLEALRTYYTPLNEYKKANTNGMYNPVYSAMPSHEYVQIVTENQMKNVETFAGWDFETVWQMTANGPTLR